VGFALASLYDTIEFRICDMSLTVEETMCIVAVIQAVVAKLYKLNQQNMSFNIYRLALIKKINSGLPVMELRGT
jgi:carboxylate-amine ligase